jgi:hypothetical protein
MTQNKESVLLLKFSCFIFLGVSFEWLLCFSKFDALTTDKDNAANRVILFCICSDLFYKDNTLMRIFLGFDSINEFQ